MSCIRRPRHARPGGFVNYNPTNDSLVIAGIDGNPSNLGMQTDYKNFAPRLGLSYRVTEKTVIRAGFGVSYVPFVDNSYAYNYPIKTSTGYTNTPTYGPALNPAGGVINFVTGIPATPTVTFPSNGTLTESAANGTIGLSNLLYPAQLQERLCFLVERGGGTGAAKRTCPCRSPMWPITARASTWRRTSTSPASTARAALTILSMSPLAKPPRSHSTSWVSPATTSRCKRSSLAASAMAGLQLGIHLGQGAGLPDRRSGWRLLFFWSGNLRRNYNLLDFDRKKNFEQTVTYELPAGHGHRFLTPASAPTRSADGRSRRPSACSPACRSRFPPRQRDVGNHPDRQSCCAVTR